MADPKEALERLRYEAAKTKGLFAPLPADLRTLIAEREGLERALQIIARAKTEPHHCEALGGTDPLCARATATVDVATAALRALLHPTVPMESERPKQCSWPDCTCATITPDPDRCEALSNVPVQDVVGLMDRPINIGSSAGPEPSLRHLILHYYSSNDVPLEKALLWTDQYIAALLAVPPSQGEGKPVAWRVKDYDEGWKAGLAEGRAQPLPDVKGLVEGQITRHHPLATLIRNSQDDFLKGASGMNDDMAMFCARRIIAAFRSQQEENP